MTSTGRLAARRGEAAGSYVAVLVGGVLLLALGFLLGRGTSGVKNAGDDGAGGGVVTELAEAVSTRVVEKLGGWDGGSQRQAAAIADELTRIMTERTKPAVGVGQTSPVRTASGAGQGAPVQLAAAGGPPPIEFDPPEIDFGVVLPNTELSDTVLIKNVGSEPLTILAMKPDCACTTIEDLAGEVIAPGESVELTAVVDPRSYQGPKNSEIRFVFDGYEPISVKIKSVVSRAIRVEPTYVDLVGGGPTSGICTLKSLNESPFRILAVHGEPPVYADGFDPQAETPRNEYVIKWDLSGYSPKNCLDSAGRRIPGWLVIETDNPDAPVLDLRVRHNPCTLPERLDGRNWVLGDYRVILDEFLPGESKEYTASLKWLKNEKPNDTIARVVSESPQMSAELMEVHREGDKITCRVRITASPIHSGLMYGYVRFFSKEYGHSQRMTVIGRVKSEDERSASAG